MRILHILDHSLPLQSGYAFRSLAILRGQRARGWETFHLTTPKQGPAEVEAETAGGLLVHRTTLPETPLSRIPVARELASMAATYRRLAALVGTIRPHILHAHSPVLTALPALRAGRRFGLPVVYEIRAFWEDAAVDAGRTREGRLRYRATRALETLAAQRADAVTTICEGLRGDLVARGVAPAKVTVIPNAVDADRFPMLAGRDPGLERALDLGGAAVLGFAGSFYGYEGLDLLITAMPRLLEALPTVRLLLVGGGPEDGALRRLAAECGVGERVVFVGRVPHEDVRRYYSLADVLVYPRRSIRLTELVTPLKPLEAMALGRVLVASDVGGHRELIRDGETGFLFRAGDAGALIGTIEHAFALRRTWPDLIARARRFVETERTWDASVARYAAIYAALAPDGTDVEVEAESGPYSK